MTLAGFRGFTPGPMAAVLGGSLLAIVPLISVGCGREPPASTFSRPPPLAPVSGREGRLLLRDSLEGWKLEGEASFADENLELGGPARTTLTLSTPVPAGSKVSFDYFQEGKGASRFVVAPVFPGVASEYAMSLDLDFDQSGFIYKRWHHCEVTTSHQGGYVELDGKVTVLSSTFGKEGEYRRRFPSEGEVQFRLSYDLAEGSRLYIRNLFLASPEELR